MGLRKDTEFREHPIFRQLVRDAKAWPQERQEQFAEELERELNNAEETQQGGEDAITHH
jgi:hypothetical protein